MHVGAIYESPFKGDLGKRLKEKSTQQRWLVLRSAALTAYYICGLNNTLDYADACYTVVLVLSPPESCAM